MKMTSVEWFVREIAMKNNDINFDFWAAVEQAKKMEKQQIIDAYNKGQENPYEYSDDNEVNYYDGNNYYIEKYEKVF